MGAVGLFTCVLSREIFLNTGVAKQLVEAPSLITLRQVIIILQ